MVITEEPPEISDIRDLILSACAGNTQAFCRLVEPLQARLLGQATALCGDASAAEDLVSETLVEAWKSLPRYNHSCRLSTWLYSILLHRHGKALRYARCRPISLAKLSPPERREISTRHESSPSAEPSPADQLIQSERRRHLLECIKALPERHRHVVLMRFFADASLPEIAAALGCSQGTVKSRLFHALKKLRNIN